MSKLTLAAERSRRRGRMELLLADLAALEADYQPEEGEGKLAEKLGKALWRVYAPPAAAPNQEPEESAPKPAAESSPPAKSGKK